MHFYFKYFDQTLFRFALQNQTADESIVCKIDAESVDGGNVEKFLPVEFCGELSEEKLVKWLKHRTIPANELVDMFVFDAIILNQDRHTGNFGFLVDNRTNQIAAPSPIFDNGLSLFCYAMDDDIRHYKKYSKTILPALYPDFQKLAAQIITHRQKKMLSKLVDFKFRKHPHYNLSDERLDFLSFWVSERAKALLKQ